MSKLEEMQAKLATGIAHLVHNTLREFAPCLATTDEEEFATLYMSLLSFKREVSKRQSIYLCPLDEDGERVGSGELTIKASLNAPAQKVANDANEESKADPNSKGFKYESLPAGNELRG